MRTKPKKHFNKSILILIPLFIITILAAYLIRALKSTPSSIPNLSSKQELIDNGKNLVLYAFSEDPMKRKTVFLSDINENRVSKVNVNYNSYGNDRFLSTKDGKYVAKWTPKTIEVASADKINTFNKIIDLSGRKDGEHLDQILWSNDGKKVFYTTVSSSNTAPYSVVNFLYIINKDGTGQRFLTKLDRWVAIQGINLEKNEVYWFERGEEGGGFYNFTTANITDGSIKNIDDFCKYCGGIVFSSDLGRAYFRSVGVGGNGNLVEYNRTTKEERILFESGKIPQGTNEEGYFEGHFILSPNEDFLLAGYMYKTASKFLFYLIPLSGEKEKLISFDPNNLNYTDELESLSPDGRYVFINRRCQVQKTSCGGQSGNYIIDLQNSKTMLFKENKEELRSGYCYCDRQLYFLSWLAQ